MAFHMALHLILTSMIRLVVHMLYCGVAVHRRIGSTLSNAADWHVGGI